VNSELAPSKAEPEVARQSVWRQWLRGYWVWSLAAVVAVVCLSFYLVRRSQSSSSHSSVAVLTGTRASASQVRLTGKTQAVLSRAILAPILSGQQVSTLTVIRLIPSGSRVKKGDVLADFDRQAQLRDFVDKQAQADDQNGKVLQAEAAELAAKAKDQTELEQAESALSKAGLEMKKMELLSRIDAEKAQQTLDEAKATLTQLKETFLLKRKAAAAAIRVLEIQRDRTRETMTHAQTNAALMQIRSPIDGIVVYNTIWKEGTMGEVQEGDQVRPGVPFMQVVDPSLMEVHVQINQEDLAALQVGEQARVHLDAYPDLAFNGKLESIDPMGKRGDFSASVRNFSATFSIQGNDPRLMPDLSAAVDVDRSASARVQERHGE
jgi:multidrug efflux pump subunit AcrA (membrane-fusion protein)